MDWRDIGQRAAWTFLQAFLAVFVVSGDWGEMASSAQAAAVAGVAAVLSMAKTWLVQRGGP
ncbi:hypothetical protein [Nitrosomonas sp.]|uniref:hypothetical protein n=1 Tax=Nitrosomonas sp. TaxID=42353 RepID=UPI0025F5E1C3|nr:hypothetical protein [Nitrosomonas sp.]MBV6448507.1 hypothetical protein [Nitrosomonas sp.]